jgi:hypothetical protein
LTRAGVDALREQRQAKSDELLHEIVAKAVDELTPADKGTTKLPTSKLTLLFCLFLESPDFNGMVGDLNERHKLMFSRVGRLKADLWYCKEMLRSVTPVAWGWMKKLVMRPVIGLGTWMLGHGLLKDSSIMEALRQIVVEWLQKIRG